KHGDRALVRRRRGGAEEKTEGENHERNLTRETGVEKSDAGTAHRPDRRPSPPSLIGPGARRAGKETGARTSFHIWSHDEPASGKGGNVHTQIRCRVAEAELRLARMNA
ncbi:MAG: hypothetical protein ACJ78V_03990, partial [Myxococcales bacterium]